MKSIAFVLLLFGLGLTIFTSIKFFTKEKVIDLGQVEIVRDKPNYLHWSPALGLLAMGIGGAILWQASRK